jgi:hypothetical protein
LRSPYLPICKGNIFSKIGTSQYFQKLAPLLLFIDETVFMQKSISEEENCWTFEFFEY